jgi:hypothetical protein
LCSNSGEPAQRALAYRLRNRDTPQQGADIRLFTGEAACSHSRLLENLNKSEHRIRWISKTYGLYARWISILLAGQFSGSAYTLEQIHIVPGEIDVMAAILNGFQDSGRLSELVPRFNCHDSSPTSQRGLKLFLLVGSASPVGKDAIRATKLD